MLTSYNKYAFGKTPQNNDRKFYNFSSGLHDNYRGSALLIIHKNRFK